MDFAKFLRIAFLQNTSGQLLLTEDEFKDKYGRTQVLFKDVVTTSYSNIGQNSFSSKQHDESSSNIFKDNNVNAIGHIEPEAATQEYVIMISLPYPSLPYS